MQVWVVLVRYAVSRELISWEKRPTKRKERQTGCRSSKIMDSLETIVANVVAEVKTNRAQMNSSN